MYINFFEAGKAKEVQFLHLLVSAVKGLCVTPMIMRKIPVFACMQHHQLRA